MFLRYLMFLTIVLEYLTECFLLITSTAFLDKLAQLTLTRAQCPYQMTWNSTNLGKPFPGTLILEMFLIPSIPVRVLQLKESGSSAP